MIRATSVAAGLGKAHNFLSIFVKWIPDEIDYHQAYDLFSAHGSVDRVEIVNKTKDGQKIGRMLFVHFLEWNTESSLPTNIAQNHPEPFGVEYHIHSKYTTIPYTKNPKMKTYILKCCINTRPIPKVEYTASQLTDMFEKMHRHSDAVFDSLQIKFSNLQTRTQHELFNKDAAIEELRSKNDELQLKLESLTKRMELMEKHFAAIERTE